MQIRGRGIYSLLMIHDSHDLLFIRAPQNISHHKISHKVDVRVLFISKHGIIIIVAVVCRLCAQTNERNMGEKQPLA